VLAALQDDPARTEIPWLSSHSHAGRSSIEAAGGDAPSIWADHKDVQYREKTTVPATTLDRMLEGAPGALPFLKLDLEGADFLALRGASATLKERRPTVAFENAAKGPAVHGYSVEDMIGFFTAHQMIPLSYVGDPLSAAGWFDFHEAWAVPLEHYARAHRAISEAVARRL
jgi:FkbM family methyltransferase